MDYKGLEYTVRARAWSLPMAMDNLSRERPTRYGPIGPPDKAVAAARRAIVRWLSDRLGICLATLAAPPLCADDPDRNSGWGLLVRDGLMPIDPTPCHHRRQRSGVTVLRRKRLTSRFVA
jgi:hypothetical protein